MKRFKWDFIIVISLIVVSIISYLCVYYFKHDNGGYVQVVIANHIENVFPLDQDTEYLIKVDKHYNKLVIENNSAYIKDADCRDRLCVNQGRINSTGQSIICLPHKVVIKIVSKEDSKVDAAVR